MMRLKEVYKTIMVDSPPLVDLDQHMQMHLKGPRGPWDQTSKTIANLLIPNVESRNPPTVCVQHSCKRTVREATDRYSSTRGRVVWSDAADE